jgi:hypothetical protein
MLALLVFIILILTARTKEPAEGANAGYKEIERERERETERERERETERERELEGALDGKRGVLITMQLR